MSTAREHDVYALDFEHAIFDAPEGADVVCHLCRAEVTDLYFSVDGHGTCPSCFARLRAGERGSWLRAFGLGAAAAAAGVAGYVAVRALVADLTLLTIVLGILIGLAVRRGAGSDGRALHRVTAVLLTWLALCFTYVPSLVEAMHDGPAEASALAGQEPRERPSGAAPWITAAILSLAMPLFLAGSGDVIRLLIFAFGLWEAFRLSAPRKRAIAGPFAVPGKHVAGRVAAGDG